jgi:hypothetical protein
MLRRLLVLLILASMVAPTAAAAVAPLLGNADPAAICCGGECRCPAECPCRVEAAPARSPAPAIPAATRGLADQAALPRDETPLVGGLTAPPLRPGPVGSATPRTGSGRVVLLRKSVLRT